jgi:hypothetical protein
MGDLARANRKHTNFFFTFYFIVKLQPVLRKWFFHDGYERLVTMLGHVNLLFYVRAGHEGRRREMSTRKRKKEQDCANAQLYRQRKKQRLEEQEKKLALLEKENKQLKRQQPEHKLPVPFKLAMSACKFRCTAAPAQPSGPRLNGVQSDFESLWHLQGVMDRIVDEEVFVEWSDVLDFLHLHQHRAFLRVLCHLRVAVTDSTGTTKYADREHLLFLRDETHNDPNVLFAMPLPIEATLPGRVMLDLLDSAFAA